VRSAELIVLIISKEAAATAGIALQVSILHLSMKATLDFGKFDYLPSPALDAAETATSLELG
jgi:hypothetical protein